MTGYSKMQITLHWLVLALVALQFLLAGSMKDAFEAEPRAATLGASLHIFVGFLIFVLMGARLMLRLSSGAPPPPEGPLWRQRAGLATHWALYTILLAMPVSGAVAWFRGAEAAAEGHAAAKVLLIALIALHAGAALYHHLVLRDDTLIRMVRRR